jgi:hypothetical protein
LADVVFTKILFYVKGFFLLQTFQPFEGNERIKISTLKNVQIFLRVPKLIDTQSYGFPLIVLVSTYLLRLFYCKTKEIALKRA